MILIAQKKSAFKADFGNLPNLIINSAAEV